jgi:hypothetical protein
MCREIRGACANEARLDGAIVTWWGHRSALELSVFDISRLMRIFRHDFCAELAFESRI